MNRRRVLTVSGALAAASLAGCVGGDGEPTATPTDSSGDSLTETPTETPTEEQPDGEPQVDDERLAELAAGNAGFALDLHRWLADEEGGNTFLSPYSISLAFAMTYAGARGGTEAEMRDTLRFTLGEDVHPAFADQNAELEARATTDDPMADDDDDEVDAFQLSVANAVWGREGFPFAEAYLDLLETHYGAGLREADFVGDPESERERINDWVADETADRIDDLLPENAITSRTVMVLTNAIYFMASWEQEFDPADTDDATFTALDGAESTVPMMEQNLRTNYADLPRSQAIELPYVGGEVSMVLIVPDEGEFETVESELDAEGLFGLFDELGDASGDLRMPRFEYEFDTTLSEPLMDLGMEGAFGGGADFSGMVEGDGGGLYIDEAYHDAFVSVDEEGTEAAAATAVVMDESAPAESFDLTVDRPFLFCIRDRPTDAVLFLARVVDAGAAQPE